MPARFRHPTRFTRSCQANLMRVQARINGNLHQFGAVAGARRALPDILAQPVARLVIRRRRKIQAQAAEVAAGAESIAKDENDDA